MSSYARFPFLTQDEFHIACTFFANALAHAKNLKCTLKENPTTLTLVKSWTMTLQIQPEHDLRDAGPDVEEHDEEALNLKAVASREIQATFNVVLSTSYQVPVLYFTLIDSSTTKAPSIDKVYDLLVPTLSKDSMREPGVVGAISMGDDPTTGLPAFFVHPCNTANAMEELAEGREIPIDVYLQVWLGLVGSVVGLSFPVKNPKIGDIETGHVERPSERPEQR